MFFSSFARAGYWTNEKSSIYKLWNMTYIQVARLLPLKMNVYYLDHLQIVMWNLLQHKKWANRVNRVDSRNFFSFSTIFAYTKQSAEGKILHTLVAKWAGLVDTIRSRVKLSFVLPFKTKLLLSCRVDGLCLTRHREKRSLEPLRLHIKDY